MSPITFVTWNLRGWVVPDLAPIGEVLRRLEPDVIALQEVAAFEGEINQVSALATMTGLPAVFAPNVDAGGARFGNAILSRLPILGSSRCDLTVGGAEPRGALKVELEGFSVVSTHLGLGHRERAWQAGRLLEFLEEIEGPFVVGGDMNDWFPGRDTRLVRGLLSDAWDRKRDGGVGATYPARLPIFRIDHVYLGGGVTALSCWTEATRASDHRPVAARLAVPLAPAAEVPARRRA